VLQWLLVGEQTERYDAKVIYTLKTPLSCGYLGTRASGPRYALYGWNPSVGASESHHPHLGYAGLWFAFGMGICPLSFLRKIKVIDFCNPVGLVQT
jgi:hypothetical protein